jgi:hypothetical protein
MDNKSGPFTSRDLALVAGMSALYLGYGYVSGVTLGHTIREVDLFFLISALFTILVSLTRKHWSATILGTVTGLILVATPGAPLAVTLALIPNGIVFDLTLRAGDRIFDDISRKRFVVAGALGNLAMAIYGLAMLQAFGFFHGFGISTLLVIWVTAIVGDTLVGALGAVFGTAVVRHLGERVRSPLIR